MPNQIILEPDVARQLEQLRVEGQYNMFDFNGIQSRANEHKFFDCVTWMADNRERWGALVINGFSVDTGEEVLTAKEYFERFPI